MKDELFRKLNDEEVEEFKLWARENYIPQDPIPEIWHPIVRAECELINKEDEDARVL